MKVVRRAAGQITPRQAPNRLIAEYFSQAAGGSQAVTLRVVELLPVDQQEARHPHRHPALEEVIYVLSGSGKMWVEGEWLRVAAGDALLVPAGTLHATFNTTGQPLRLACFFPAASGVDGQLAQDLLVSLGEAGNPDEGSHRPDGREA